MTIEGLTPEPLVVAKAATGRSIGSWNQTTGDMVTQLTFENGALIVPIPGTPVGVGYYLAQTADATGNFSPSTGIGGLSVNLKLTVAYVDLGGGASPIPSPCDVGMTLAMTGAINTLTGALSVTQSGFAVSAPAEADCGGLGGTIGSLLGGPVNSMTLSFSVQAKNRFVATAGTDSGSCANSAAPCQTINYAVGQAFQGETIHVGAGTYPEMVVVDKGLTFEGSNVGLKAGVSPQARVAETVVKGFRSPGVPHPTSAYTFSATVDGFTIDPQGDAALIAPNTHHLVALFGGPNVIVRNNIFNGGPFDPACEDLCTTMTDSALWVRSGTFVAADNSFTNFRRPIDVNQTSPATPVVAGTISDNSFTHITSRAIWLAEATWDSGGVYPGITVSGNNFNSGAMVSFPAAIVLTTGGNVISNNTFTDFSQGVIDFVCDGTNVAGASNTIVGNTFDANRTGIGYLVAGPTAGCLINATIQNNSFLNIIRFGVRWMGTPPVGTTLNATCNYWGSAAGPEINGTEPDAATPDVDVSTWNTSVGDACSGF